LTRPAVGVAAVLVTVIAAAGLTIVLTGGGSQIHAPASAVPQFSDLRLETPVPGGSAIAGAFPRQTSNPVASVDTRGIRAVRIQIARLNIDLKIVDGDGIDAPIGKAAHYPGSGWPNGGTNIYIYAHARTGMFLSLWDARVGDAALLTLADGTQRTYVIDSVLPKVPWNALEYVRPTAIEQLTLQTSTSYYSTAPRFIVIAHPAS
jgi:LPXTG-site transpeptidase (sortase) family protein